MRAMILLYLLWLWSCTRIAKFLFPLRPQMTRTPPDHIKFSFLRGAW